MHSPWIEENQAVAESGGNVSGVAPSPRFQHVAASINNSIYIIGGTNGKKFFDEIHQYDPEQHQWICYKAHAKNNDCKDAASNHQKYQQAIEANGLVSILRRTRNIKGVLKWELNTEPMVHVEQVQELIEAGVYKTWFGHTSTYFPEVNAIVIYGGGDEDGPFESESSLWVLSLGSKVSENDAHSSVVNEQQEESRQLKSKLGQQQQKDVNDKKKENATTIGKIKRTEMKWERVKLQDTTRDIKRMGHATAKYGSYIYIFGGFANAQYLAGVSRVKIAGYNSYSGEMLWKQPVAWEICHPYRQPYEILKTNMMTPRVGHTVSTFDKLMFIWGGVANFRMCLNYVYEFNAESFEWNRLNHVGSAPRMRYGHGATEIEGSQRLFLISGGIVIEEEDGISTNMPVAHKESILSDLWTFNIDHKLWVQLQMPGLSYQSCQHDIVSFGRNKSEIFVFGGTKSKTHDNDSGQITYNYSGLGLNTDPEWRQINVV